MGAGIAQVAAAAGMRVTLVDVGEEQLARALAGIGASLAKLASKGQCDDPDAVLARISTSTELADCCGCGARDRGRERGRRSQAGALPAARRRAESRRDPRLEHVVDPDRAAGRRHGAARAGLRDALHEPARAHAAGRADPRPRDERRDRRERAGGRGGDGQDRGRGARRAGLPGQPHAAADAQRGRVLPLRGGRRRRGDRHRHAARHEPPAGAARAGRPDRSRHVPRDPRGAARGLRRSEVPALPAVASIRRGGATRPQGRARVPRTLQPSRYAGRSGRSPRSRCGAARSRSSSTSSTRAWRPRTSRSAASSWPGRASPTCSGAPAACRACAAAMPCGSSSPLPRA